MPPSAIIGARHSCLGCDVFQNRRCGEIGRGAVRAQPPRRGARTARVAGSDRIMALFLEIVGAVALVVLAIVVILIAYVMWLVHRAERRNARWRQ
jgi:hypothetical protein